MSVRLVALGQMSNHAWCSDPARDEAVRAAEDGRSGPLPTLEEAIYRAGHFGRSEDQNDPKCTERESRAVSTLKNGHLSIANHDVPPGARVSEPVAWGVAFSKGVVVATSTSRSDAVDMQAEYACETVVVPLYAAPPVPEANG